MMLEEYRNNLLPSERSLFDEFTAIGVTKTIYALLDANVDDSVIQRVVVDHWEISREDFSDFLINAKKEIALHLLRQHLTFQGYAADEADRFISSHMVKIHLSHNHELLAQWRNPEKIIKTVQQKKKSKEK
mgnify:CR=1 FL=1